MTMDHETCSAQLPGLARGELADAERRAIEAHLAGCADCARELVAVRALMALPTAQLTGDERRALHQAVLAPKPRRWARLAPALGAVGLVVLVAVGVTSFIGGRDDSLPAAGPLGADTGQTLEQDANDLEQGADEGTGGARDRAANKAAARPRAAGGTTTEATVGGGGTTEGFYAGALGVETTFARAELGPHLLASDDLLTDDADRSLPAALRELRRNASDAGPQMSECTNVVQDVNQSPLVPAFASVYPADELLVMGFVFRSGTEQRYAFWGWHLGDCTRPTPIYVTGAL